MQKLHTPYLARQMSENVGDVSLTNLLVEEFTAGGYELPSFPEAYGQIRTRTSAAGGTMAESKQ